MNNRVKFPVLMGFTHKVCCYEIVPGNQVNRQFYYLPLIFKVKVLSIQNHCLNACLFCKYGMLCIVSDNGILQNVLKNEDLNPVRFSPTGRVVSRVYWHFSFKGSFPNHFHRFFLFAYISQPYKNYSSVPSVKHRNSS